MPPTPLATPCAAPVAGTAFAAALARVRSRALRTLGFVALLCLCITVLLVAFDGGRFGVKAIYAYSVGACCTALTDAGRLALAWLSDRLHQLRGQAPDPTTFAVGWGGAIPAAAMAALVGPPLGLWLGDQITGYESASLLHFGDSGSRVTIVVSVLGTAITVFVLSTLERLSSARAQAEAAQRAAAENQLRLLQSQLEPHMLFNTLANLRVLIGIDAVRAQAMLDRLIAFLRATLAASRTAAHPLATEFEHLADYLALMAIRMGPRLVVHFDLPADLATLPVPPLLLQPLVENAIKHGLEPKVEGGRIDISAQREGATLVLKVRDTGLGLGQQAGAGGTSFGLEQVRLRLATLHGAHAGLVLAPAGGAEGGALASVTLPLHRPSSTRASD